MATSSSSKKRRKRGRPPSSKSTPSHPIPDRLSSLPHEILLSIISHLDLREAMRTSVLSFRWRHLWTLAPLDINIHYYDLYGSLDLDADEPVFYDEEDLIPSCIAAVTDVLSRHRGTIRKFRVPESCWADVYDCIRYPRRFDALVGPWAKALAQKGVENVTFHYKLPRQFLTCESLRSLNLINLDHPERILRLPSNLRKLKLGLYSISDVWNEKYATKLPPALLTCQTLSSLKLRFHDLGKMDTLDLPLPPNLRDLTLWRTSITELALSRILAGCPFLDALCLEQCSYDGDVCVMSPSLRKVSVKAPLEGRVVKVVDAPKLEILLLPECVNLKVVDAPKLQVLGLIRGNIHMLELGDICFKDGVLTKFSNRVCSLKTLAIKVNLEEPSEAKFVADLLKCFPCLENLDVMIVPGQTLNPLVEEYWEKETSSDYLNNHLKVVNMTGFLGRPSHMGVLRFLVCKARLLKVISFICTFGVQKNWEETNKRELLLENRASPGLQVIFKPDFYTNSDFLGTLTWIFQLQS